MRINSNILEFLKRSMYAAPCYKQTTKRQHHGIPFLDLYESTTGMPVSTYVRKKLKDKYPVIETLNSDRLQCTLRILKKFDITALEACQDVHVFTMNPITMDNYGEILKECGFTKIIPKYIIKYHTIVKSNTIASLKKQGLLRDNLNIEETIRNSFHDWPISQESLQNLPDSSTSILTVRMSILEKYLERTLSVTSEEFNKYCRNYLPMKHKPMSDIREALDIAQNVIKFEFSAIRRNGFIISADPINTKLIIQNVKFLAGLDIREAIKVEPAILKNNYNALLQIRDLLEEYRISGDAQRRSLKVYCMRPSTVRERLEQLRGLKEYQVLRTNPRVLSMVVHKRKVISRLEKIQAAKKQCYSLNHLVSSSKVFNNYIGSFGNKVCGRDLAVLITSALQDTRKNLPNGETTVQLVLKRLRRHKYWLHAALNVIDDNIQFLKKRFDDDVILNNCQLLLYPVAEVEQCIDFFIEARKGEREMSESPNMQLDTSYNNLRQNAITDNQILSLVLYEIEKKYHFSGDGIWARQDGVKLDTYA